MPDSLLWQTVSNYQNKLRFGLMFKMTSHKLIISFHVKHHGLYCLTEISCVLVTCELVIKH